MGDGLNVRCHNPIPTLKRVALPGALRTARVERLRSFRLPPGRVRRIMVARACSGRVTPARGSPHQPPPQPGAVMSEPLILEIFSDYA